jgi:hypothetical protein
LLISSSADLLQLFVLHQHYQCVSSGMGMVARSVKLEEISSSTYRLPTHSNNQHGRVSMDMPAPIHCWPSWNPPHRAESPTTRLPASQHCLAN